MAQHYRKMVVHSDHLEAADTGPPWIVLWDTVARADGQWSTVRARTEAGALERAAHFVKLGFVVHEIKDPSGAVVMNAGAIAERFAAKEPARSSRESERPAPTAEQSAREILRGFVEEHRAVPGRMLATSALHALLQGVGPTEFKLAVSFAKDHGWLSVGDGTLTLTHAGFTVASE